MQGRAEIGHAEILADLLVQFCSRSLTGGW
jgi:hypothetical protein